MIGQIKGREVLNNFHTKIEREAMELRSKKPLNNLQTGCTHQPVTAGGE